VVSGGQFNEELVRRVQARVDESPLLSRRQLSREICQWMGWQSRNGRLQEMGCRKMLAKLNRQGVLRLPERDRICQGDRRRRPAQLEIDIPERCCTLAELGEVTVTPVEGRSQEGKIARALLQRYHYLGAGSMRGNQIRYVVRSGRWYVGVVTFSSAVWAMQARDAFIGWSEEARRANLRYVVCNDRFLIVPTVVVKNLASHVLARTLERLGEDWEQRYKERPVLVETFVDPERFEGTCYQAANWTGVGRTAGRRDGVRKRVFVRELCADWRKCLCEPPAPVGWGATPAPESPLSWAHEEFGRSRFFDGRLKQRLCRIAENFYGCPEGSIPEASGGKAATMGAYRFFANPQVTMDVILNGHIEATIDRMRQHAIVLAPQDTTTLSYSTHPMTEGLGPVSHRDEKAIGLLLHDTMAFTVEGTPLGVLDAQCWARDPDDIGKAGRRKDLPIEQKESMKWLRSFRRVAELQKACPQTKLVSIGDRESDIYELFGEATKDSDGPALLVRLTPGTQRKLADGALLWEFMRSRSPDASLPLHLPRAGARKARDTMMDLRFASVELKPPHRAAAMPTIQAWAVFLSERPDCVLNNDPIEWMLLTTYPVATPEDAKQRVDWYTKRWGIEIFHRTLKSGCRIKDRQLGTADRLEACLGVDMVVAWRIYHLTMLGRETPDLPCTVFFKDEEWKALHCYVHKTPTPPPKPPSLDRAMRMVAQIGGHLGRKSDGPPGTQTLWRGLQRLETATEMYVIFTSGPIAPHLTSGP
jgi:Druantia protein DruA/Transposase DNA-binding/Transposase Tn5 dimerisation domain